MAKEPTQIADEDLQKPSQLEPYPTGNPPDPMEEYYKVHPERKLEAERAQKEQEPKPAPEEEQEGEPEEELEPEPEDDKDAPAAKRGKK